MPHPIEEQTDDNPKVMDPDPEPVGEMAVGDVHFDDAHGEMPEGMLLVSTPEVIIGRAHQVYDVLEDELYELCERCPDPVARRSSSAPCPASPCGRRW